MKSIVTGIGLFLFFGLFYAIGFSLLSFGIASAKMGWNVRSWPTVAVRLDECTVVSSRARKGVVFHAQVKYVYMLNRRQFPGENLRFNHWASSDQGRHVEDCRRVETMAPFMVRYDPEKPHASTIFPSEGMGLSTPFYFGLFWLSVTTIVAAAMHSAHRHMFLNAIRKLGALRRRQ